MPVERSEVPCPDCGQQLQVIYATELKQVVSGYACPDCGFATSQKDGLASVPPGKSSEYLLRIEKPLSADDVRDPETTVREAFRARARESMATDELWLLIDRTEGVVVDLLAGDSCPSSPTLDANSESETDDTSHDTEDGADDTSHEDGTDGTSHEDSADGTSHEDSADGTDTPHNAEGDETPGETEGSDTDRRKP